MPASIKVDIAVACNYMQSFLWWSNVLTNILVEVQHGDITIGSIAVRGSALPDNAKNNQVGAWVHEGRRSTLTDVNRNGIVGKSVNGKDLPEGIFQSDAEWVMWIDDDTVPQPGAIRRLLNLQRDFVGGLYFSGRPPYLPLAYLRTDEGFYRQLDHYTPGTLVEVDALGMGCTLIHKSVYTRIMETHEVFHRPNASMLVVPKKAFISDEYDNIYHFMSDHPDVGDIVQLPQFVTMIGGEPMAISKLSFPGEDDNRAWPFYSMEYGRTEDLHFCELCRNAGIKIYVDTSIVSDHWKTVAINHNTYLEHLNERKKETPNP